MPPRPKSGKKGGGGSNKEGRKRQAAAAEAFERYYGEQYGDRWADLRAALMVRAADSRGADVLVSSD